MSVDIKPTSDLFIAALWSNPKNEPILRSLLSGVMTDIGQPAIEEATVLNPFNILEYPNDKEIRLDVRVKDETKAVYNVEVQTHPHPAFFDRMLYYWAETYESQLQKGGKYKQLHPVRSIIITEFSVFPKLRKLHAVFELRSRENPSILFSEHCQIHVLRLGDLIGNGLSGLEQFDLDLQRWLQFWVLGSELEESEMTDILQDCPPVQAAHEEYRRFLADPVMREKAKARERFLTDRELDLGYAFAEGEAKKARDTALNMKRKGYAVADIADITGLPASEIERL